ncbi:MAG: hypothetical protein ABWY23_07695 [Mycetocola sp.]
MAGAMVAVLALVNTVVWLVGPHPDAASHPVTDEADPLVRSLLAFLGADADRSSIRGYEEYRGFEPWFFVENQGFHCLMLVHRASQSVDGANCVPPGVDLFADIGEWRDLGSDYIDGVPLGSIVRFHYRGNSVDVFVYPTSEAD